MRVLRVCQEMEKEKRGLFGAGPGWRERERAEFHVEQWGGVGGFLCALFEAEVLTEGPWPPLSRNSLTLSLRARRAHMLHSRGRTGAQGGAVRRGPTRSDDQPSDTILSGGGVFARGDLVYVSMLNEPFQRPRGGLEVLWRILNSNPSSLQLFIGSSEHCMHKIQRASIWHFYVIWFGWYLFIVLGLLASAVPHRGSGFTFQVGQLMMTCTKTQCWGVQVWCHLAANF